MPSQLPEEFGQEFELVPQTRSRLMDRFAAIVSSMNTNTHENDASRETENAISRRVVRKLDFILLPFLSLFFLVNSLDRSNIGNAETAHFTGDAGLAPGDLNTAVALFFAFFVALQPVGAACGRRFGMARWVPSCMVVWGICTALHVWVTAAWQLMTLRIIIGILEAGFYPTTVAYLSLFYTRYEFARRLGVFYGQYAIAGALGGLLAYAVFSAYPGDSDASSSGWKPWQVLFLLEGGMTIVIAGVGFFWLPKDAETAWFLTPQERRLACQRIVKDRMDAQRAQSGTQDSQAGHVVPSSVTGDSEEGDDTPKGDESDEAQGLLGDPSTNSATVPGQAPSHFTRARGLDVSDIIAAFTDWKVYYLLLLNILSAIPAAAFTVFLPLVVSGLGFAPASANLFTAPPFLFGAAALALAVWHSDRTHQRLLPILYGLALLIAGLSATVLLPRAAAGPRYAALCVLLAGSFVASPLTIAWLAGNIERPGKRAVVLGINGWGNLAGVFSALLFDERFAPGYEAPFFATLACVVLAFAGYVAFRVVLVRENRWREGVLRSWTPDEVEAERRWGKGPLPARGARVWVLRLVGRRWGIADGVDNGRVGEEKLIYSFGI